MTYSKPTINVLGNAKTSIEDLFNKADGGSDGINGGSGVLQPNPAYDLDE